MKRGRLLWILTQKLKPTKRFSKKMCGIIAISSCVGSSFPLERSLETIKHRGPDDRGIFISQMGDCHLGNVRLSIIDLTVAGHQPMEDSSGRYVISFNGEIYNFQSLKETLTKKYPSIYWKSNSDTEVILEGFAKEGIIFFEKLNGMFAIAIFDKQERRLHILRDPLGIKPMFFTEQNGNIFFCSELKGLLAIPRLQRSIRRQSMADQLAFMYVPEPYTMFEEFLKVEPGVCITYREGVKVASARLFGYMDNPISFSSDHEMIECFYDAFSKAVKRQLISDVPVSIMLSGGVDSSAVAYEVVRAGANIRDAYTISFNPVDLVHDQQGDDVCYAKKMASKLGLNLNVIQAERNFIDFLPELSKFLEDGISDPAAINTYLICKSAISKGVKVMLSGQGADEYLGGYRRYLAERMFGSMPSSIRLALFIIGKLIPRNIPGKFNAVVRRINRFIKLSSQIRDERLLGMYIWGEPAQISGLFNHADKVVIGNDLTNLFESYKDLDGVTAMMKVDHRYDLRSLNLAYTDKMSMAVGVEARVPFLDFDLVRVMNSIPSTVKLNHGVSKYILKKAMEPHLPHEIVYRRKAGFALPIRAWLRDDNEVIKHYFDKGRIRRQGIFDTDSLQMMCEEQILGRKDHASVLFSMLCIQIWLDSHNSSLC